MDKTFLLKIDQDLQKVHFPAIEKYPQEERELISKILKNLKNIHYKKLSQNLEYNRFEMEDMYVFEKDQETRHYLDKLMKEGFFSYWDIYVNHQNKAIVSIVLYGNF